MPSNFQECLQIVLQSEGGFTDKLGDGEKWTNMGVTNITWSQWVGHEASEKEMRNLTIGQISPLYEQRYWRPSYCEVLPRGLSLLVFSMAINAGTGRSVKLLQSSVGCVPDGVIGARTMELIKSSNVDSLIAKFSDERRQYYRSLKLFPKYGNGWLERVDREEKIALGMTK